MDTIKQWAFALCAAMVACGIAQMMLPKSAMEKIFRITVSVFFLCCLLSPVLLHSPGLRIEIREQSQEEIDQRAARLQAAAEAQADQAAAQTVKKTVEKKLAEMGINCRELTIDINTNGQSAPRAALLLDPACQSEDRAIRSALAELGLTAEVSYTYAGPQEVVQDGN